MKKIYRTLLILSFLSVTGCKDALLTETDAKEQIFNMETELSKNNFSLPKTGMYYSKTTIEEEGKSFLKEEDIRFNKIIGSRYLYEKIVNGKSGYTVHNCFFEKNNKYYCYDLSIDENNEKEYGNEQKFSNVFNKELEACGFGDLSFKQINIFMLETIKWLYISKDETTASNGDVSSYDLSFRKSNESSFKFEAKTNEITDKRSKKETYYFVYENYLPKTINYTLEEFSNEKVSKMSVSQTYTWNQIDYIY